MNKLDKAVIDAARKVCCVGLGTSNLIGLNQALEALDQVEEFASLNRLVLEFRRGPILGAGQPYVIVYENDCSIVLKAIEFWQENHKGDEDNE